MYLRNANCANAGLFAIGSICQKKRIALGLLRVDGNLTVEDGIHLIDNGFQITGNPVGTSRLTVGSGAILTLGSGNAAIATTTGAGADLANNTTGMTSVTASASAFPLNISLANLNLDPNSVVIYQASVPQPVKGLGSAVANQQYGHLVVQNAVPGAVAAKFLDGPVQVRGSLVINPGSVLADNGYQVSYSGPGGQTLRMASSVTSTSASRVQDLGRQQADAFLTIHNVASGLVLGSQISATAFPNYADAELDLYPNTTVTYTAGIAQAIRGLSNTGGLVAGQRQYANLVLINPVSASPTLVSKTLAGPVVVRGNFTIYPNNNLVDGGNGITGTSNQSFVMRSLTSAPNPVTGSGITGTAGPSRLTLGTATVATGFPTGYRTGNGTVASPSDIHFEPGTTVVYASGRPQSIQGLGGTGNTTYANLVLANPAATPAATGLPGLVFPTVKTLVSRPTTVRGTLTIYPNNTLFDNGLQFDGTAGGQFRMHSVTTADSETGNSVGGSGGQSRLVLGNASIATRFPAGFRTGDGSAANPSDIYFEQNTAVVYNAGVDQPVQVLGTGAHTAYADLFLSNPVNGGAALVSKTLQAMAGSNATGTTVRGTFTIGPNNHLVDNGFQLNGVAGRTFSMLRTTLAANPTRTYSTDPATIGTTGPSRLTVGTATKGTAFPTGYQTVNGTDINLEPNTTVVYNAGVDQPVQALITTASLTANANYAHVVLANPSGSGFPVKTLSGGNVRIRGSLTISANNNLDAGAGSGTLFLQGDWTSSGRFSARTGTVVMEGEATQTVIHSNTAASELSAAPEATQDFYNWIINKPAGEVLLKSRLAVSGTATFAKGLVHSGHLAGPALTVSPANVLIFRDNATAAGASNHSFVTGAVRKTGNDAFAFPVGAAGVTPPAYAAPALPEPNLYRPVGISAPVGTAAFIAQYYYSNPGDAGFDPTRKQTEALNQSQPLLAVSKMEYWMLNREAQDATAGTADVLVTLSWHDPQSGAGTITGTATPADYQWLRVSRWNGIAWQNLGGAGFGPDPIGGATASNTGGTVTSEYNVNGTAGAVNQFSPFTLSSGMPNNSLPVTLLSFKGHLAEDHVLLNWQTTSEVNTAQFVVERSRDGMHFVPVATVKAKRSSSNVQRYQVRDTGPLPGLSYYRLKIVDEDGRFEYAKTISVSRYVTDTGNTLLYPNPNEGRQLFVECSDPAVQAVAVYDLVGREVLFSEAQLGSGKWELTFGQRLKPGVYLVVVAGKTGVSPQKIRFVVK
ncbi:MAG: T9SS type A sorting domain-containing protein [Cytophagales bacterium]|nr:T9SS type A sorting domain-containing protein [Cytophagales bacterium]